MLEKVKELFTSSMKEARELIYEAEVIATKSGMSVVEVLERNLKTKPNPYVRRAVQKLKKGKPRDIAYKGILPDDVLKFVREAEKRGVSPDLVFENYVTVRRDIEEVERKITGAVLSASFIYIIYMLIVIFLLLYIRKQLSFLKIDTSFVDRAVLFSILLGWVPPALLFFAVKYIPDKIPVLSKVYNFIRATQYLLLMKTMLHDLSLPSSDLFEVVRSLDRRAGKIARMLPKTKRNIEGVLIMLSRYFTDVERMVLAMSVEHGREKEVIEALVNKKRGMLEERTRRFSEILGRISQFLIAVPVFLLGFTYLKLIQTLIGSFQGRGF